MSTDAVPPSAPDIEALMASPEFQAQMALLAQQAAAQLAALVEALRTAESAIGTPTAPVAPPPTDEVPDGLPWEPPVKLDLLGGVEPPVFLAPALAPQPAEAATRDVAAKMLGALAVEAPLSALAEFAPAFAVLAEIAPAAAALAGAALPEGAGMAEEFPGFDSFATWAGAEGTGI